MQYKRKCNTVFPKGPLPTGKEKMMPKHPNLIDARKAALVVIDIQKKLAVAMNQRKKVVANVTALIKSAERLGLPILLTEQYPEGIGGTVSEIRTLLADLKPITKRTFSCCGTQAFIEAAQECGAEQFVVVGMETHVCILQTALDLLTFDRHVYVVADAVCSRFKADHRIALRRMEQNGITIVTTESVLFELLNTSTHESFKELTKFIK